MFRKAIAVSLLFISIGVAADALKCGDAQAVVINSTVASYPYLTIAVVSKEYEKFYRYPAQNEFLKVRCEKLPDGSPALLVLHACGGSGCAEATNFGVINAVSGAVLLEPNERWHGNAAEAKKILGKEIEPFSCSTKGGQHSNSTDNGEICFFSGVELG